MTVYVCKYCGKVYKTQKGFEKHHCEKMDRYNEVNDITLYLFNIINNEYCFKRKLPENVEERKIMIINNRYYNDIKRFERWTLETLPLNIQEYVKYLKVNRVPYNDWTKNSTYHNYLYYYLKDELPAIAIQRSEKYLKDNGLTMETISSNRLYLAILYGNISRKYLEYIGCNVQQILDEKQWLDVRDYFIDSYDFAK